MFSFDPGSYTVTEGDIVRVSGVIDQFNGLLEIVPDEIEVLSSDNILVSPALIIDLSEDSESSHIAFGPYSIDSIVATEVSGFNVFVTHETGTKVLIRVDADSGFDQGEFQSSNYVRGIGTQFDPSFPFTSGYQILALEFAIIDGIEPIDRGAILMSPNPAGYTLSFKSDFDISQIEMYAMDGKSVQSQKVDGRYAEINTADLSEGLYTVKAMTDHGIWTSLLSVIR